MQVGELSRRSGVSARSLRHYEHLELLTAERLENGYREFGPEAVDRARAIQMMFGLSFSRDDVRSVLSCMGTDIDPERHREVAEVLGETHDELGRQISRLEATRALLADFLAQQRASATG
jgi:DNA-binding transcriptional MerR regulator